MVKKLLPLFFALSLFTVHAQSNFEYELSWSTYFGPVGAKSWTEPATPPIQFDANQNIHLTGLAIGYPNNYAHAYYDQFLVGSGGQSFNMTTVSNSHQNGFAATFNQAGTLNRYQYYNSLINQTGYRKKLKHIDKDNNFYYEYAAQLTLLPLVATANAWHQNPSHPQLGTLIVKETPSGTTLWSTYIPVLPETYIYGIFPSINVKSDEAGNIYISSGTYEDTGIATPGSFQDQYQNIVVSGYSQANGYLVKLDGTTGGQLWGTYLPFFPMFMDYHAGSLYFTGGGLATIPANVLATPNAFQSAPSLYVLQKFNATTGQRDWGTFYGHTTDNNYNIQYIAVNDSGLFVVGDTTSDAANAGYFGTPGAHQTTNNGSRDMYLSKFDHSGNRIWSSYFGGTGLELIQGGMKPLAIDGDNAYITARTIGYTNNIATPGTYKSAPTQTGSGMVNHFFAKFSGDGSLEWASYFGNSYPGFNEPINIAVHNSSLYLYGETTGTTGYATPGSWQTQMIDNNPAATGQEKNVTFLAKFDIKQLNTAETSTAQDLVLYDNPNRGSFSLQGDVLSKKELNLTVYDAAGRVIHHQDLHRAKTHHFHLSGKLKPGHYVLKVADRQQNTIKTFKMIVK